MGIDARTDMRPCGTGPAAAAAVRAPSEERVGVTEVPWNGFVGDAPPKDADAAAVAGLVDVEPKVVVRVKYCGVPRKEPPPEDPMSVKGVMDKMKGAADKVKSFFSSW